MKTIEIDCAGCKAVTHVNKIREPEHPEEHQTDDRPEWYFYCSVCGTPQPHTEVADA